LDVPETSQGQDVEAVQGSARLTPSEPPLYSLGASTAQPDQQRKHRRPSGSKYITLAQATNIIEAVDFAKLIGVPLVAHLTIHWAYADVGDDSDGRLFAKVREGLDKWMKRHGIMFAGAWCIERMSRGQADVVHCHLLFHLPFEYRTKRKLQIEAAIYRLIKRHGEGYWAEQVIDLRIHLGRTI
jgi:hypothetical protein